MTYREATLERRGLYRSRDGMILGVCRGIAEYLDFSVFWMRVIAVVGLLCSGFLPAIVVYLIVGFLMKPEPSPPGMGLDDVYRRGRCADRAERVGRLRHTYEELNRRLRRIESIVTSRDYDWDSRLHR